MATQFASEHGIVLDLHGRNLGAEHLVHVLGGNPDRLSLYRADGPLPPDVPVRVIPIVEPVLLYPWSLLWLRANTHPVLPELLSEAAAMPEPCVGADGGRRVELHTFTFRADAEDAAPDHHRRWVVAVRPRWSRERRSVVGPGE